MGLFVRESLVMNYRLPDFGTMRHGVYLMQGSFHDVMPSIQDLAGDCGAALSLFNCVAYDQADRLDNCVVLRVVGARR